MSNVALVRKQHEAFGLQGRVVDVAHVDQAHPCYKSRTAEYPPLDRFTQIAFVFVQQSNTYSTFSSMQHLNLSMITMNEHANIRPTYQQVFASFIFHIM